MREISDEEVLSTELHITVEQYLRIIERVGDMVIAYLDKSEPSEELEEVKKNFKALFRVIRQGSFEGFKDAIIKGSANHDTKIN